LPTVSNWNFSTATTITLPTIRFTYSSGTSTGMQGVNVNSAWVDEVWRSQWVPQTTSYQQWSAEQAEQLERERARAERAAVARRRRIEEQNREMAAAREREQSADARARELLMMVLTPAEKRYLTRYEKIRITSQFGKKYWIDRGVTGNVHLLGSKGRKLVSICAHPDQYGTVDGNCIPTTDVHVAQILALKNDEHAFWALANCYNYSDESGRTLFNELKEEARQAIRERTRIARGTQQVIAA